MPDELTAYTAMNDSGPFSGLNPPYSHNSGHVTTANHSNFNTSNTEDRILQHQELEPWKAGIIITLGSIIVLMTVLGNALVCLSVALVRKLRTPSNLLIVSLAISDFCVGFFVMPLAVMTEVTGGVWLLGRTACDAFTSADVFLCTASILNLCAISIDRYFAITRPFKYALKRTPRRMVLTMICVWVLSALISIPPLIVQPIFSNDKKEEGVCQYNQTIWYQIYATVGAFYLPLIVMIVVYYRIYMVSHKIAREEAKSKPSGEHIGISSGLMTPLRRESDEPNHHIYTQNKNNYKHSDASRSSIEIIDTIPNDPPPQCCGLTSLCCKRPRLKGKESKATKTLGVIMGAFTACWLPFFILALIRPFLPEHIAEQVPRWIDSLFLWLGYANSCLNPVIYARFNREFRQPFKEILLCRCRTINNRIRMNTFTEQYGCSVPPGVGQSRHSLKPPQTSVVKYDSQGQTIVRLGNGNSINNNGHKL